MAEDTCGAQKSLENCSVAGSGHWLSAGAKAQGVPQLVLMLNLGQH